MLVYNHLSLLLLASTRFHQPPNERRIKSIFFSGIKCQAQSQPTYHLRNNLICDKRNWECSAHTHAL